MIMVKKKQTLFVGGFPSGGTDLLKNILNAHPDIYINGEMPFLYKLANYGYTEDSIISSEAEYEQFIKILRPFVLLLMYKLHLRFLNFSILLFHHI